MGKENLFPTWRSCLLLLEDFIELELLLSLHIRNWLSKVPIVSTLYDGFQNFSSIRILSRLKSGLSSINRNATFITRQSARASNECSKNLFLAFVISHFKIYSFVVIPLLLASLFVINNSLVIKVYFQYNGYFHIQIFMFLCSIFYNKLNRIRH